MVKIEKIIEKLRNAKGTVAFSDVKIAAEFFGYSLNRISGSHHIFVAPGRNHLVVPVHKNKVKVIYVKKLFEEVGLG